ncbi:hypothetical protein R50076_13970 [Gilvimarinus japonicus]
MSSLLWPFDPDLGSANQEIIDLINEIYIALQNGISRLAIMGIRALVETIMIKKVGDHNAFSKNMDRFQEGGYISPTQREALDAVLEAGHATIHRAYRPSAQQVQAAIDIVENIIEAIYVSDQNRKRFSDVPKRGS